MSKAHTVPPVQQKLHNLQKFAGSVWHEPWVRTALKTSVSGVSLALGLTIALQLAYPSSRALPQTSIAGKSYGYKTSQQISADIAAHQQQEMRVITGDQTLLFKPAELGVALDPTKDAKSVLHYSWQERLIPFSFLWERREVPYYSVKIDDKQAQKFAASLSKYDQQPIDAEVRIDGQNVAIHKHQNGYSYNPETITAAVKDIKLTNAMNTSVEPETTYPGLTDDMAAAAASKAQERLQEPIEVRAADKTLSADAAQIAGWIEFKPDSQNKELRIQYNRDKIRQWLVPLSGQVYVGSTPRTITMVDGIQASATNGAEGRALDNDATADAVIVAADKGDAWIEAKVVALPSTVNISRNYNRSSAGLQALLQYWDESHTGTWGVVLRQLDGGISANFNGNRQFTSASIYKIYVAYATYSKIEKGEIDPAAPTSAGKDVNTCLDFMIVRSDNACAEALGNMVGWNANDGMLHAKGFGSTTIAYGGQLTTAQDAASYLTQLQAGSLLNGADREALLNKMRNNIYRYAIPAATPGIGSANKLGALGSFNHDVAIVYHPKGTYVLAVLSQGSSHGEIRELARQVAAVMGQ